MVKLDFSLERDVPELTDKVLLITGGKQSSNPPRKHLHDNTVV